MTMEPAARPARSLLALLAFLVLVALVASGALASADQAILDAIQRPHAEWFDLAASVVTVAGQSEVTGAIALGVAIVWRRHRRGDWWLPLLIALVVAVEVVCKILIAQPPPPHELSRGVELLPFLRSPTAYAFPSGHVARVAFLVTALRWPVPLGAAAILVMALTRIYLGEHWPSDVIGGLLLGYIVAVVPRRSR